MTKKIPKNAEVVAFPGSPLDQEEALEQALHAVRQNNVRLLLLGVISRDGGVLEYTFSGVCNELEKLGMLQWMLQDLASTCYGNDDHEDDES